MILNLEQQVCPLESAKRLKDLGFPQDSYFYWAKFPIHKNVGIWHKEIDKKDWPEEYHERIIASAYTVAELGELLPEEVTLNNSKYPALLQICRYSKDREEFQGIRWCCAYMNFEGEGHCESGSTEVEARAKMLIYLKEDNLI